MYTDDPTRLHHMQASVRDALSFVVGKTRQDVDQNPMLADALVQCLVLIGRSAVGISPICRTQHPYVPWQTLSARADELQHNYAEVDLDAVWYSATQELPTLAAALESIIPVAEQYVTTPQEIVGARRNIEIPAEPVTAFCRRYHINILALFGSVLREDFHSGSDIDVLVEFESKHTVGLFTLSDMQSELAAIFQRPVDLCTPDQLSPYIRQRVVDGAETLYTRLGGTSEAV